MSDEQYHTMLGGQLKQILAEIKELREAQVARDDKVWHAIDELRASGAKIEARIYDGLTDRTISTDKMVETIRQRLEDDKKERVELQVRIAKERIETRRWVAVVLVGAIGMITAIMTLMYRVFS